MSLSTKRILATERLRAFWYRPDIRDSVLDNLIWLILAVALVAFSIIVPGFLTIPILANVLLYSTFLGVMVIGETLCLLTGNFDLSVESVLAFTAMLGAVMMTGDTSVHGLGFSPLLAVPLMVTAGAAIGLVNGVSVAKLKINPFVVTLATMIIFRGLTVVLTQSQSVVGLPGMYAAVATTSIGPISTLVIVTAALYLVFHLLVTRTLFGRKLFAVGGNRSVSFAFGLNPDRVVIIAFVLSGALAAIAGWFLSARLDAAVPSMGEGMTFDVMAAAVIGGISLNGGKGSLIGALGGVLLLGSINTALTVALVDPWWFNVVRGVVIFVAVGLDTLKHRIR